MITLTGKLGRLAILIRKYSTLADPRLNCPYCHKRFERNELLAHIKTIHDVNAL